MRTTVTLPDRLFRDAKAHAARTGRTLGAVMEDALRRELARHAARSDAEELPTFGRGGVATGVDLRNNAALRELFEEDAARAHP